MCRLVMWVAHGFDGKPDSHAGVQTPPWARVKVGNCLRLVAIGLVGVASFIGAGMFLEATAGREKEPEDTAPPPPAETVLSDISVDKVELYDLALNSIGTMSGFIKNASRDVLEEVDTRIVVRNSRKDIIFRARHAQTRSPARRGKTFFLWERRASSESPDTYNRKFEWTWECHISCRGKTEDQRQTMVLPGGSRRTRLSLLEPNSLISGMKQPRK